VGVKSRAKTGHRSSDREVPYLLELAYEHGNAGK
jgi:hypothetical protein